MKAIEWLKAGWRVFAANPVQLILGFLIFAVLSGALEVVNSALGVDSGLLHAIQMIIGPAVFVGWALFCLRTVRGEQLAATRVFDGFSFFVPAFITGILVGILAGIGFVLLIVPGVIVVLVFSMWAFGVGDQRLGTIGALKYSMQITKGHRLDLFVAWIIGVVLAIIAAIPLGLGLLIVGPWLGATYAIAYEDLAGGTVVQSAIVE
jgi:hypothetical protein